jgi:hypothetical protein
MDSGTFQQTSSTVCNYFPISFNSEVQLDQSRMFFTVWTQQQGPRHSVHGRHLKVRAEQPQNPQEVQREFFDP